MLKGINISEYYPQVGTRWMSDNDILCSFIQQDENGGYRTKGKTEEEIKFWEEKHVMLYRQQWKKQDIL